MSTITSKKFADRLSDLFEESRKNGIDYREISDKTNISTGALSNYINDVQQPNISKLAAIATYFNVSADWLLGMSNVRTPDIHTKAICNEIGLSEKSIEWFRKISRLSTGNQNYIELIDFLLSLPCFEDLLLSLYQYCETCKAAVIYNQERLSMFPEGTDFRVIAQQNDSFKDHIRHIAESNQYGPQISDALLLMISTPNEVYTDFDIEDIFAYKSDKKLSSTLKVLEQKAIKDITNHDNGDPGKICVNDKV